MDINIVINKDIYLTYKDEILKLNARIFSEPYFIIFSSKNKFVGAKVRFFIWHLYKHDLD